MEDGYTLDGKGFTITAVDGPTGSAFIGAVVQNDGTAMNVKNLKIEGGVPNNCVATFNGVAFINAGGSIKNVTLNNIGQTTGCQSGRAISPRTPTRRRGGQSRSRTTPSRPTTRTGSTCAAMSMRRSSGTPSRAKGRATSSPRTASSSTGPTTVAQVEGNKVSGNYYTGPASKVATGILAIDGKVTIDRKNTLSGNEVDIYDSAGTISGKKYSA